MGFKKVLALSALLFIVFVSKAVAQERGYPFTKRAVTQQEYALAIERNDRSVLNVDCLQIVAASRQAHPELRFVDCKGLAIYVRQLESRVCPQVLAQLARVMNDPSGVYIDTNWRRRLDPDEVCLYDPARGIWFASLKCGNLFAKDIDVKPAPPPTPAPESPAKIETIQESVLRIAGEVATRVSGEVKVDGQVGVTHDFERPLQVQVGGQVQMIPPPPPPPSPNWFKRHWKPLVFIPTGVAVGAAIYCYAGDNRCKNTNVQVTNIYR